MTIELDAGTEPGEIPDGYTIPLANTQPNINPDQILASLDGDTRAYLKLLLAGGAEAFGTPEKSQNFAQVLRRLDPTAQAAWRQLASSLPEGPLREACRSMLSPPDGSDRQEQTLEEKERQHRGDHE